ncbi:MAG: hypothetical protein Q4F82_11295 [bacterium]|nr:hypothetical protein [bacterium]
MEALYKSVNDVCMLDSIHNYNTVLLCHGLVEEESVPIILCKDENGIVDHIGYCFLSDSARDFNKSIVQFVERELLTILVEKDVETALRVDVENGLVLKLDDNIVNHKLLQDKNKICSLLKGNEGVTINRTNNNYNVMIHCLNGQILSFLFPADCKLISGMDKREQEIRLGFQLKNHVAIKSDSIQLSPNNSFLQLLIDSVYVEKGGEFSIPQINNDLFYFKNDSVYSLVTDTSLVAMSFSNAVLAPSANQFTINVKHRMFGFVEQEYTIDSRDFNDYFSQGYERYFGIETLEPENLSGTLILYNRDEEYINLAYVTTTLDDIVNGGKLSMDLYSFIPQHNIKTLYGEE